MATCSHQWALTIWMVVILWKAMWSSILLINGPIPTKNLTTILTAMGHLIYPGKSPVCTSLGIWRALRTIAVYTMSWDCRGAICGQTTQMRLYIWENRSLQELWTLMGTSDLRRCNNEKFRFRTGNTIPAQPGDIANTGGRACSINPAMNLQWFQEKLSRASSLLPVKRSTSTSHSKIKVPRFKRG
ncbi:MAG: hypothetical protein COA78_28245 [Blastopirellula sp.]|nr:MAG: hypothetical protein COA78_28245 [Blastopirellula sp.]